ncbi:hypothetical protein PYCCODRAFT_1467401 [Trametes coccinea BRFM310]|uniref:DUF6534 domain-containing protein n=1 Tax=Trametes coccinea (strain BRFM310) TaxID=1353009 RepID=A0A1Y2ISC5_TRAC3|nr:hypothetical protein PYCCODRAFT_1467401 [Trametes coccinea BRFM310]
MSESGRVSPAVSADQAALSFYAHRVLIVSTGVRYRLIGAAAVVFSTVTLGCTLGEFAGKEIWPHASLTFAAVILGFNGTLETILRHVKWLDFVAVTAAIVSDTLTAGVLITFLRTSRTGLRRTDSLVDRLIAYCLSTGLLIGITNAALCIVPADPGTSRLVAAQRPHRGTTPSSQSIFQSEALLFFGIVIAATKLYSNSVLVALNIRRSPLDGAEQTYPELILLSDVGAAAHRTPAANGLNRSPAATGAATRLAASAPSLQSDHGEDAYGFRGAFKVEAAGIC